MTADAQTENRIKAEQTSSGETVLGFAVLGCLVAGAVGILKALGMESGFDVLLCLLGSVAAFGTVFYLYLGKR
ncbi:MAG: hypothetical protein ACLQVY_16485 [Limisphaerales bacterium]